MTWSRRWRGRLRGDARRQALQVADDEEQLSTVLGGERRDDQPLLGAAAARCDEPFLLEAVQGGPDRRATEAEALGDGAFGDARARAAVAPTR